jgi:hypothetical protein
MVVKYPQIAHPSNFLSLILCLPMPYTPFLHNQLAFCSESYNGASIED